MTITCEYCNKVVSNVGNLTTFPEKSAKKNFSGKRL